MGTSPESGVLGAVTTRPRTQEPDSAVAFWTVVGTTGIGVLVAAGGHGLLWYAYSSGLNSRRPLVVPYAPIVGICLTVVGIVAFGGFYLASRRARIAIASSFLLTFIVLLSFVLTIDSLAARAARGDAKALVDDLRWIVITIIVSYFGSETAVSATKVKKVADASSDPTEIKRADRDLAPPPRQRTGRG